MCRFSRSVLIAVFYNPLFIVFKSSIYNILHRTKVTAAKGKPLEGEAVDSLPDKANTSVQSEVSSLPKENTEGQKVTVSAASTPVTRTLPSSTGQKIIILATQPSSNATRLASFVGEQAVSTGCSTDSSNSNPTKSVVIRSSSQGQATTTTGSSFVSSITTDSLQGKTVLVFATVTVVNFGYNFYLLLVSSARQSSFVETDLKHLFYNLPEFMAVPLGRFFLTNIPKWQLLWNKAFERKEAHYSI